jgi:NTE family protein
MTRKIVEMTIRSVDNLVDSSAVREERIDIAQENVKEVAPKEPGQIEPFERFFLRSRKSMGTAMVQQQITNKLSFPLPLPRIPTPVGMIDFTKLISVMGKALLDGLKNFGSLGLGFARSVASTLGGALRSIKNAGAGFGDLVGDRAEEIKTASGNFLQKTSRSLDQIEAAAGRLATSAGSSARRVGEQAGEFARTARDEAGRLNSALKEFGIASEQAMERIGSGTELLTKGILEVLSGDAGGILKIVTGQRQIRRGLDDAEVAGREFADSSTRSLEAIERSAGRLKETAESEIGSLQGEERRFAQSILRGAENISEGALELLDTSAEATGDIVRGAGSLGSAVTETIDGAWSKVAEAAEKFSRAISGTNQTTKEFINNTKDFRKIVEQARQGDPAAQAQLKARWGYTTATLPPAGTQFIDPNFLSGDLVNGQVTAGKFPTGQAATKAPRLEDQLFGNGRRITIPGDDGRVGATINNITINNMDEYRQVVARQRAEVLGLKNDSGEPVQVHMAFEGGGGQGKRYIPAISEMYRLGVVPSSVTGTSVGAIVAGAVAAGADPKQLETIVRDERIAKFIDLHAGGRGGFAEGQVAYQVFDEVLRDLTGIHDRPVTFADLKIPLHIIAAKYADTDPPAGQTDLSRRENRIFVFGPETTPNTPVALAMRASMAIPGVFDPVEMVDPTTGRTVQLTDGGSLDNLPVGYNRDGLPTIAANLNEPNTNHPDAIENNLPRLPLPGGQLQASNPLLNGLFGALFVAGGGGLADDFKNRTNPPANTFVLSLPIWDLEKPQLADDGGTFSYDPKEDPRLDLQTRRVTDNFFRDFFNKLQEPDARGTNIKPLPKDTAFTREFELDGRLWTAQYDGGHSVQLQSSQGEKRTLYIGQRKLENWIIDDASFGDLGARLRLALEGSLA